MNSRMNNRGFVQFLLPLILSLFGISLVSIALGWWINILLLIFLSLFTYIFLSKAVDLYAVSQNATFPTILGSLGIVCAFFVLVLIDPALFSGSVHFSVIQSGAMGSATQPLTFSQWFSDVPVSESIMANMNSTMLWAFIALAVVAFLAVLFVERK